jgi:glycosyl hydrolase family 114
LTEKDSVNYIRFMAKEAARYNMSTGLKNSDAILPQVQDVIQFAVNEECAAMGECNVYKNFLKSKPVFHIEYTKTKSAESAGSGGALGQGSRSGSSSGSKGNKGSSSGFGGLFGSGGKGGRQGKNNVVVPRAENAENAESAAITKFCTPTNAPDLGPKFSTVIKIEALDGWVRFCDGRVVTTRISNFDDPKGKYAAEEEEQIPARGGGFSSKQAPGGRGGGSGAPQWGYASRREDNYDDDSFDD